MTLVKWKDPVDMMPAFSSFVDSFFGRDFPNVFGREEHTGTVPRVNVKESDTKFMVEVAAPGLSKEDFTVNHDNDVLTISGKKKEEKEEKGEKWNRREFYYSSFERNFYLPDDMVEVNKIEAHYKDGVLMVDVPKKEKATSKKEVKTINIT